MSFDEIRTTACVLNSGVSAWAFEPLAEQLSVALGVEVSTTPRRYNYVLGVERDLGDPAFEAELMAKIRDSSGAGSTRFAPPSPDVNS